jgi:ActR/RegA family two-component response regulator
METAAAYKWLVIENDDEWYEDVAFAAIKEKFASRETVFRARSADEYCELQRDRTYDIITIDLELDESTESRSLVSLDRQAGLKISPRATLWNPKQLVIVFSAFIGLRQAVLAMRNGAWDCISKVGTAKTTAIRQLMGSVKEWLEAQSYKDTWFLENVEGLVAKHAGKHIAVVDGKVIADDDSIAAVREKARKIDPMQGVKFFLVPCVLSKARLVKAC